MLNVEAVDVEHDVPARVTDVHGCARARERVSQRGVLARVERERARGRRRARATPRRASRTRRRTSRDLSRATRTGAAPGNRTRARRPELRMDTLYLDSCRRRRSPSPASTLSKSRPRIVDEKFSSSGTCAHLFRTAHDGATENTQKESRARAHRVARTVSRGGDAPLAPLSPQQLRVPLTLS